MARYQGWVLQKPGSAIAALTLAGGMALGSVPVGEMPAAAGPVGTEEGWSASDDAKAAKITAAGGMWCSQLKGRNSGARSRPS